MNLEELYLKVVLSYYFFLSLCKVQDPNSPHGVVGFQMWSHFKVLIKIFAQKRFIIILKARQVGITTFIALYALWKALTQKSFNCLIISAGEKPAARVLDKIKFAYDFLPDWLKANFPIGKRSETELTFLNMGSRIVALPSTESPAIGESASLVIMDEHDYHAYPESDYAAAEPTASAGGQIICVSTSDKSKPDSLFKTLCRQAMSGENEYFFYFINYEARPGRGLDWYELEKKQYIGREDEFDENYPLTPEQALSPVSGASFFPVEIIKRHLENSLEPIETRYGFVHIYTKFQPTWAYAVGADISQGVGGDYQAAVILGKKGLTVEDVAYIHSNEIAVKTFAFYTNELAKEYNFPIVCAEANAMGRGFSEELLELGNRKLFYRDENRERLGWFTDATNREIMLVDLAQSLADGRLIIRYKPLLIQLLDFQRLKGRTGKIEIKSVAKHDDLVMAVALAYQMIKDKKPGVKTYKSLLEDRTMAGMYK